MPVFFHILQVFMFSELWLAAFFVASCGEQRLERLLLKSFNFCNTAWALYCNLSIRRNSWLLFVFALCDVINCSEMVAIRSLQSYLWFYCCVLEALLVIFAGAHTCSLKDICVALPSGSLNRFWAVWNLHQIIKWTDFKHFRVDYQCCHSLGFRPRYNRLYIMLKSI